MLGRGKPSTAGREAIAWKRGRPRARHVLAACLLVAFGACFDGPESPPSERDCVSNCERQARANCSKTPADFLDTCKQDCIGYRVGYADCRAELDVMSGCVARKVVFSCNADGTLSADPVAACMDEEYACRRCTDDFTPCRN